MNYCFDITNELGECVGEFEPFSEKMLAEPNLLQEISDWRNSNLKYFLNQKPSTLESTTHYVKKVIRDRDHHMYLMKDSAGEIVGHFGFRRISPSLAELDNLLRCNKKLIHDFVQHAEKSLIRELLAHGYAEIQLRVFSSNVLARRIHEALGFKSIETLKLSRFLDSHGDISFQEAEDAQGADGYLIIYSLSQEDFLPLL
jgi:RimJ/RimL family protein N-acetyltransferase